MMLSSLLRSNTSRVMLSQLASTRCSEPSLYAPIRPLLFQLPLAQRPSCSAASRSFASNASSSRANSGESKSGSQAVYLFALVTGMVGATYLSVPLYRLFCQATGYGGTVRRSTVEEKIAAQALASDEEKDAAQRRVVTVTFNGDVSDALPWSFWPAQKEVVIRPVGVIIIHLFSLPLEEELQHTDDTVLYLTRRT
jgi:hypothetical protein